MLESVLQRNLSFELHKEQIRELTSKPCYYCGHEPSTVERCRNNDINFKWGDYVYNGIDRVDNNCGYIISNCVPCCEICNRAKGAVSIEDWQDHLTQFVKKILTGDVVFLKPDH